MRVLERYRDDGALAVAIARLVRLPRIPALVPVIVGASVLGIALAFERGPTAWTAVAAASFVVLGAATRSRPLEGRLDWLVPVLLRAAEYATVFSLVAWTDRGAAPAAYAFVAAAGFRQYDVVYRLRHQRVSPPEDIDRLGGGWDGRIAFAFGLARADALGPGFAVGAVWLAMLFTAESVGSWVGASAMPPGEELSVEAGGD